MRDSGKMKWIPIYEVVVVVVVVATDSSIPPWTRI